ncbi:hypothetical protein SF83666_d70190 (plasmid) [Sinorhizobium fredii CCBAU 83666]|nr:hypothetical protein SF83666_d70190 [Sinorhizobium fredii CCBAU 83666]
MIWLIYRLTDRFRISSGAVFLFWSGVSLHKMMVSFAAGI